MHCQTDNVFFLISQPSNIEAKPQLTPEQQRRTQLTSALFTGLSGPSKSIKMKPKAQAKVGSCNVKQCNNDYMHVIRNELLFKY